MVIYGVYIISKSGGLIYNLDNYPQENEVEKTFSFPLDLKLVSSNQRLNVAFGQRDGIRVGYSVLAVNGEPVANGKVGEKDVLNDVLQNEDNFPISIRFGIPRLTTNEKIVLASTFHSMYLIAAIQIASSCRGKSGSKGSSGIEVLETDNFRLNCFQTVTGVKFMVISDLNSATGKDALLKRIYDLYTDFALKNPFYSLEMPIRCELFDSHLQALLDQHEKSGINSV